MRGDPAIVALRDDFVWLDIETESEVGARAIERFGVEDGAALWLIDHDKKERRVGVGSGAAIAEMLRARRLIDAKDDDTEEVNAPEEPIATLEADAHTHAEHYDVHDRLARAYHREGREDEALAAIFRAAKLAHGPYRIVILAKKADIALARGDRDGARAAIAEALDIARPLALRGRFAALRARLEVALSEWNRSQKG
jgi:hypothetical protein